LGNTKKERSKEIAASEQDSDESATVTSSSSGQVADVYRETAMRLALGAGLFLAAAVALFGFGLFRYAGVACLGSILNAAVVVYLIRAGRRLTREPSHPY
jgi:uncharacterized protein (UPF0548 family)